VPRRNTARPIRRATAQPGPAPTTAPPAAADSQDARTGTIGVYTNSTAVATKTNTPLVNIPQSVSVLTKSFIQDQSPQNLTDLTRYVPGVAIHQGEGNRDELVIRGIDSSANFFVNSFRDDVQIFRDLYNAQSVEILKGPSALTFGRGAGGGLVNRTLKEADWTALKELMLQTGSYYDRRAAIDVDQPINENVAARVNAVYEKSNTFRDFGHLERYGIDATVTFKPDASTKIRLSYEHFHDERTADCGNPSQALSFVSPSSTRCNPAAPFAPGGDVTRFFGSPDLSVARANVDTVMAFVEHDFGGGLTVKNGSLFAEYKKFYQNIYPGNGPLSGAVNPSDTAFNRAAHNHETDRTNLFNQTDFVFKGSTGPIFHTIAFGTEFGRQTGHDLRNTGIFPNGTSTIVGNPWDPTYFGPVVFIHQFPGAFSPDVSTADSNSKYRLNIGSAYARDTVEITPWLQVIGGARMDSFDIAALDQKHQHKPGPRRQRRLAAGSRDRQAFGQHVALRHVQRLLSARLGRSVQCADQRHGDPGAAKIREQGSRIQMEHLSAPAFQCGSVQSRPHECAAPRSQQSWVLPSVRQEPHPRLRDGTEGLHHGRVAIGAGLRLHRRAGRERYVDDDRQRQSHTARSVQPVLLVEQISVQSDLGGRARRHLFLQFVRLVGRYLKLPGFIRFDAAVYARITENWKAQLNVENIFNKHYWASADGNNNISRGQGRTIRFTTFVNF
jgi:outer membrane receptor for monomeric catechols